MYANGEGVPQDYKGAVKWFRLAADQGLSGAKCILSELYATGAGVNKDISIAKKLAKEGLETGGNYCKEVWEKYNLANY
jgi:hypothetical protein